MKCIGIIWNSALKFQEDILKLINSNCKVNDSYTLHLNSQYEDFVRKLYGLDQIAEWKINKKLEYMRKESDSTDVIIIIFEIISSETFYNSFKQTNVCAKLELLKTLIRLTCSIRMENYFFDITFHCSDTEEEFEKDLTLVRQFKNKGL